MAVGETNILRPQQATKFVQKESRTMESKASTDLSKLAGSSFFWLDFASWERGLPSAVVYIYPANKKVNYLTKPSLSVCCFVPPPQQKNKRVSCQSGGSHLGFIFLIKSLTLFWPKILSCRIQSRQLLTLESKSWEYIYTMTPVAHTPSWVQCWRWKLSDIWVLI
jgi:hypothetical protein